MLIGRYNSKNKADTFEECREYEEKCPHDIEITK